MKPLITELGMTKLSDIDQSTLDAIALKLMPDVKPSTRRRVVYVPFIATWKQAVASGKAEARTWQRPSEGRRRLVWITPAEAELLLAALEPRTRALVTFYLGTGARATEALDLLWSDVSPAAHRVTLWADITKASRDRTLELCPRVRDAMPPRRGPDDPVFLNSRGEPWHAYDAVNLALKRACKRAGVRRISCHALRHSWATWRYAVTRNLEDLMKQGGWASPELALRYMHGASDDLAAEVRAHNWTPDGRGPLETDKILKEVS